MQNVIHEFAQRLSDHRDEDGASYACFGSFDLHNTTCAKNSNIKNSICYYCRIVHFQGVGGIAEEET